MAKTGPIIIVEDDEDDQELLKDMLQSIKVSSELLFFENGMKALAFLKTTTVQPFIIFCDMNMPIMNGVEFRKGIINDPELKRKSIPFIFLTTTASMNAVNAAYEMTVQGFFEKKSNIAEFQQMLQMIISYWSISRHPNFS